MTQYMFITDIPFGRQYLKIIKDLVKEMSYDVTKGSISSRTLPNNIKVNYNKDNGCADINVDTNYSIEIDLEYLDIAIIESQKIFPYYKDIGLNSTSMNIFVKAISTIHSYNKTLVL